MKVAHKGVLYLLGAAFSFSLMSTCVKLGGERLHPMELVLARGLITLILSAAWLRAQRIPMWGNNKKLLIVRGLFGFGGLTCFYTALTMLPLAETTVIHYVNPILTAILAAIVLRERVGWPLAVGIACGLAGVLLVGQPPWLFATDDVGVERAPLPLAGVLVALAGAAFSAAAYVTVRKLRHTDHPMVIVFFFPLVAVPATIPLVWKVFLWPQGIEWLWLLGIGVTTQIAQVFLTRGLVLVPAGRATTIGYTQIVFATLIGVLAFGEIPTWLSLAGAALIVAGTLVVVLLTPEAHPRESKSAAPPTVAP